MNREYGHFSDDGWEYIVTTPHTPRPWINYLTNGDYCALCSHVGGGFSFYLDHRLHGVLQRGLHNATEDLPGRLIYIKDEDTGEVWNANVHPIGKFDTYECRHGMGYTTLSTSYREIGAEIRYCVAPGIDGELWTVRLTNRGHAPRRLAVYTTAVFSLGNVSLFEGDTNFHSLFHKVAQGERHMTATHDFWFTDYGWSEHGRVWPYRMFATTPRKPDRWLLDRAAFLGPFRGFHNPAALEAEWLPAGKGDGKHLASVCQWRIALEPGESWSTQQAIGVQRRDAGVADEAVIVSLQNPATYEAAWQQTRTHWRDLFQTVQVQTPDANINTMMNVWNKHQLMVNFYFGRAPSYYHKGQYPAMRDSCQDAFGVIPISPALAKKNLRRIGEFFFADGQACGGCNRAGIPEGPSVKVDLPLWFVLAVADYLRETGDWEFLDEALPLMDGGESTVYAKMLKGIDRMLDQRGAHGLPLMGKGDWNDAANMVGCQGKGESVWLGQFLCLAIREIDPIMRRRGDAAALRRYQARADELKRIINEQCWDGDWFVRAFRDDGRPLGVKGEKEGFIWINSQTWAVIGGLAEPERLNRCMDAVEQHMGTPYGLMNLAPAYTQYDPSVGLITAFQAGWKENAAVFSHASAFNVVARAMLGRGRDAVDLYRRILPASKDRTHYKIEPYIYAQFCAGPAAGEEMGHGFYHWLTGTAAWMFRAMTDYIIGVHPDYEGLRIQPAVDPSWKRFSMERPFRGAVYHIEFENPQGVEAGVQALWLDGRRIQGNLLPLPTGHDHHVRVVMG